MQLIPGGSAGSGSEGDAELHTVPSSHHGAPQKQQPGQPQLFPWQPWGTFYPASTRGIKTIILDGNIGA